MYSNFLIADHLYRLNGVFVLEIPVKVGHFWCLGSFISVELFAVIYQESKNAKLSSISDNRR